MLGKWDSSRQDNFNQLLGEPLALFEGAPDLWELPCPSMIEKPPTEWKQKSGVYIYWFKIKDTSPIQLGPMLVTDPLAYSLDYRVVRNPGQHPAAVV